MAKARKPRKMRALADVVEHILSAIGHIKSFTAGMSQADFDIDIRTIRAVERCLEIISEASRDIPPHVKAEFPNIEWHAMADAGNFYRHAYEYVKERVLWQTIHVSLDPLQAVIAEIRERFVTADPKGDK